MVASNGDMLIKFKVMRESSPAKNRRSTNVPRNQPDTDTFYFCFINEFVCHCARQLDDHNVTHCAGAHGYDVLVAEIWPWVDAGVYSFIPLVVIITLNSLIVRHVVSARRMRRHLASFRSKADSAGPSSSAAAAKAALGDRQREASGVTDRCDQGQNARMIALLLAVSITFVAATLPRCAALIATEFINRSLAARAAGADNPALYQARVMGSVRLALAATDLLMYANHAANFFLYCATGQKFRRQLCAVAYCVVGRPLRQPSSQFDVGVAGTKSVGLRRFGGSRSLVQPGGRGRRTTDKENARPSNVSL